mmetsp:Transcript_5963/g.7746  ORF Transcript_5963/g.7746 Transcript_5963/m.7746 type:complete len:86 (+) Transcript_5963:705-962(+)
MDLKEFLNSNKLWKIQDTLPNISRADLRYENEMYTDILIDESIRTYTMCVENAVCGLRCMPICDSHLNQDIMIFLFLLSFIPAAL